MMKQDLRVLLIGGTSSVGKSTLATLLAARLGWRSHSTDQMARYPGRPWASPPDSVKPHVVAHYQTMSEPELVAGQLAHYQGMWPLVETLVRAHAGDAATDRLVLEGSGIWPDNVMRLRLDNVGAVWLTASPALIAARIHAQSGYATADAGARLLIDRFVARSQGYDREMTATLARLGLLAIEITPETEVDALASECLDRLTIPR